MPGVRAIITSTPTIYDRISVKTVINARGATTAFGGTVNGLRHE